MKNYNEQADNFLKQTNTTIIVEFLKNGLHFDGDKLTRDIYEITISRGSRSFKFTFGQSIYHSGAYNQNFSQPTNYDILACLQKYDVGSFEDFCSEFGYETDSKRAEKTYKAVCEEYKNVCIIWNDDEIEALQEIQ